MKLKMTKKITSKELFAKYIQILPNCYSLPMVLVHVLYVMNVFVLLKPLVEGDVSFLIWNMMFFLSFGSFFKFSNKVLQFFKPWILLVGYILGLVIPLMQIGCSTALILKYSIQILRSVLVVGGAAQIVLLMIDTFLPLENRIKGRVKATFNELCFIGLIITGLAIICWLTGVTIDALLFVDISKIFIGWFGALLITMFCKNLKLGSE
mgnify:CR=1 FL=1